MSQTETPQRRISPLEISPDDFRTLGYRTVDRIAEHLRSIHQNPVTRGESPRVIRQLLGAGPLPHDGEDPFRILEEAADLLMGHSLFNGHPRFFGYITSSAAPIGALADLLAGAINPNVGGWALSPVASEIEAQTVRWIAEMIGYPADCGGLLVSGGNMANFVCFLSARKAKIGWDIRVSGVAGGQNRKLRVYASKETHTWIQKAADLFGLGTDAIRWIPTDRKLRMDVPFLRKQIENDKVNGDIPIMVVGTAGSVSTGAVDPLPDLAGICREHQLWFHVDGAYGGFAAVLPDASEDLKGLSLADSVAVDPHKWLYAPLEAGCALVRTPAHLTDAFSYHPPYYHFPDDEGDAPINFHEHGPQNSRGFRALKVWLALKQVGRKGYIQMISEDISLARALFDRVSAYPELQRFTCELSITTFRFVPPDLKPGGEETEKYLNQLNTELLTRLQNGGETFLSNAVIGESFVLRACVVNFRTSLQDIQAVPDIVIRIGKEVDQEMRQRTPGG